MVARDFLRLMPASCQWRFDVLSVYYDSGRGAALIRVISECVFRVVQS